MGTNMVINFYAKPHINPIDYGFEEDENCWLLRQGHQRSVVYIDKVTRKIQANGVSSKNLAVLFKIAERGGIEIEEADSQRQFRMMLTEEEVRAIEAMRGHPEEENE